LERNLNLVLQVGEITDKVVVAVNLMDEARRKGLEVDARSLSRDLGVPAVPLVARTGEGIQSLLQTIDGVVGGTIVTKPLRAQGNEEMDRVVGELAALIEEKVPGVPNPRWLAIRLLDGDASVEQALSSGRLARLAERQRQADLRLGAKTALAGRQ
jgi:ferrous iron transport protein B